MAALLGRPFLFRLTLIYDGSEMSLLHECSICGDVHDLALDIAAEFPDPYLELSGDERKNLGWLSAPKNPDFCKITYDDQVDHFIRGVIEVPVIGTNHVFMFGVWTTLSEKNWAWTRQVWGELESDLEVPMFGWLSTQFRAYPGSLNLPCDVYLRAAVRPMIRPHPGDHALIRDHLNGVTLERLAELRHSIVMDA